MARTVGIVAEYNPFHNGHKYLLERALEIAGSDGTVISVMSGDFVQRGEPAVMNKHARAAAACRAGVNVVAELPLPWALMSAEGFASGGVEILHSMGADTLAFGAESDNITELEELAEILLDGKTDSLIDEMLRSSPQKSYATARRDVIESLNGRGNVLDTPNNILAVEYIKAALRIGSGIDFEVIRRAGALHDSDSGSMGIRSASCIRELIDAGSSAGEFIPASTSDIIQEEINAGRAPVTTSAMEQAILSRLRMLPKEAYDRIPDSRGGAGNRLYSAVRNCGDLNSVLSCATTGRYPTSRMRRMAYFAALNIDELLCRMKPPYIRILAADSKGREYLRKNAESLSLPVITKPASVSRLGDDCRMVFESGSAARDLYVLGYSSPSERIPGSDYRTSPFML